MHVGLFGVVAQGDGQLVGVILVGEVTPHQRAPVGVLAAVEEARRPRLVERRHRGGVVDGLGNHITIAQFGIVEELDLDDDHVAAGRQQNDVGVDRAPLRRFQFQLD